MKIKFKGKNKNQKRKRKFGAKSELWKAQGPIGKLFQALTHHSQELMV